MTYKSNQPRHQWKLYWEVLTAELSTIQDKKWWNFKPSMHDTSDEEVEWSSSDNDEDSNKSSSTYSPEEGHFLSLKHLGNKDHQPCTKTSTLDRKVCHSRSTRDPFSYPSNVSHTFSALELQACSRYIFSGFELPLQHINTIFCLLFNTSIFTWRMSCASCINNYKKIATKNMSQIQLLSPSNANFMAWNTQRSHTIIPYIINSHLSTAWASIACLS